MKELKRNYYSSARIFNVSSSSIIAHAVQPGLTRLPNIKNIIAVGSGKGGVGKSTVSTNLALALQKTGARVGILDADIYGPSQPLLLNLSGKPEFDGQHLLPLTQYDLQVMSIGFLIENDAPAIWRGPMVTKALQQMLYDTKWDNLDVLIIDLPPGTGDIQLTMAQKIPVTGAIIVTTPQDLSLIDAQKALVMFQKVHIPVLGIIENMSTHRCSVCGHEEAIFGEAGAATMAKKFECEVLGQLPLDKKIRELSDAGMPIVFKEPENSISKTYVEIAEKILKGLAKQPKDYSSKFGKISQE
jgi:ATP-binding protein involved in chromosome partitioning